MMGFSLSLSWIRGKISLIPLLKQQETLCALLFLSAAGIAWGVAVLKGLAGCPLCASQRWGMVAISLGFILSLRFKSFGSLLVMIASGFVMERAWLQLVLENGVRLEQFAYVWNLYQKASAADQQQLVGLLRPFYDLTWPLTKLATYSLFLSLTSGLMGLHTLLKDGVRSIRHVMSLRLRVRAVSQAVLLLSLMILKTSASRDFGVQGALFEIVEEDFVSMIQRKAQSMDLTTLQAAWKRRVEGWAPHPVGGLRTTLTPRTFTVDPTYVVPRDIADHEGRVFAPRGLKVNPLKILPFMGKLLFVQGESEAQMMKVKDLPLSTKVILVSGSPLTLMKTMERPLYFDQGGVLTGRLGIQQVPALVAQEGDHLLVEEKREMDL